MSSPPASALPDCDPLGLLQLQPAAEEQVLAGPGLARIPGHLKACHRLSSSCRHAICLPDCHSPRHRSSSSSQPQAAAGEQVLAEPRATRTQECSESNAAARMRDVLYCCSCMQLYVGSLLCSLSCAACLASSRTPLESTKGGNKHQDCMIGSYCTCMCSLQLHLAPQPARPPAWRQSGQALDATSRALAVWSLQTAAPPPAHILVRNARDGLRSWLICHYVGNQHQHQHQCLLCDPLVFVRACKHSHEACYTKCVPWQAQTLYAALQATQGAERQDTCRPPGWLPCCRGAPAPGMQSSAQQCLACTQLHLRSLIASMSSLPHSCKCLATELFCC